MCIEDGGLQDRCKDTQGLRQGRKVSLLLLNVAFSVAVEVLIHRFSADETTPKDLAYLGGETARKGRRGIGRMRAEGSLRDAVCRWRRSGVEVRPR